VRQLGKDAFVYAAEGGHLEVLDMMLKHGIDMQAENRMLQAFVTAAQRGNIEVADYLLKNGLELIHRRPRAGVIMRCITP
jgi:ankyrin repeat protein